VFRSQPDFVPVVGTQLLWAANTTSGVLEDVAGPAAKAGVRPGEVIVSVNRTAVTDPAQLKDLVAGAGKTVALLIQRDENRIYIPVPLGWRVAPPRALNHARADAGGPPSAFKAAQDGAGPD